METSSDEQARWEGSDDDYLDERMHLVQDEDREHEECDVPDGKIGVSGATFLIFNKMIGTGIFSTPSSVFASTGCVGMSILLWLAGGVLALCGLSVYLEFGLAIPRSGGEKNYLERVYRRPRGLVSSVLAAQLVLLGFSSGNALAFGRYVLFAGGWDEVDGWPARAVAVVAVSFAVGLHAAFPRWGVRMFSVLGVCKLGALCVVVLSGLAALAGFRRVPDPHNFDHPFRFHGDSSGGSDGGYGGGGHSGTGGAYAYSNALLSVIVSYKGWEGAHYVASELRRPRRTLAVAAPLAVAVVTVLYVLANIAYFAAVPSADVAHSEVLVAAVFFRNVFGQSVAARALPALAAVCALGTVLASSFTQSRVVRELAREDLLPYSAFWASLTPLDTPAAALFLHWIVTVFVIIAPPTGPAFDLIIRLYAYPSAWINAAVTAGLIYLQHTKSENWSSPWRASLPVSVTFLLTNVFLCVVPFVPPAGDWNADGYPYYLYPVVGVSILLSGALYWWLWARFLPRMGGYRLVSESTLDKDGHKVVRYRRIGPDVIN